MRIVLFCENLYSFSILDPIYQEAIQDKSNSVLWYIHKPKIKNFTLPESVAWTYSIQEIFDFSPEAIFVPGNIVPYYLPGVKIQIFHGYAAEKKGHYHMRRYFDLYLTQGPKFTAGFNALADKFKNFEVIETGWSKKDFFINNAGMYDKDKDVFLTQYNKKHIVLYAPTFSPKLTSLNSIKGELINLINSRDVLLVIKLHPLTAQELVEEYKLLAKQYPDKLIFVDDNNLNRYALVCDIMISDTSSVVYEFSLLRKPVITLNSIADEIYWNDIKTPTELIPTFDKVISDTEGMDAAYDYIESSLDPYKDGLSSKRMIEAAKSYVSRKGVPAKRKVNIWRKYTCIKTFGSINK